MPPTYTKTSDTKPKQSWRSKAAATRALASGINASGRPVTPSVLPDSRAFIRVSVGQTCTEQRHVVGLWQLIDRCS